MPPNSSTEGLSDWSIRIILGITGVAGGLATGLGETVIGLVNLILGILRWLVLFLFGFFGAEWRERFDQYNDEIEAALANLLPALEGWFSHWWEVFQSADEDQKTVMLADALGQILAIVVLFEVAASRAGSGTTLPARFESAERFALAGGVPSKSLAALLWRLDA